ncbi:hypothetical protein PIIN_09044 [Serendipita indica DSM 11827]|uniref:Uncharacterized protein n=1 Tax=Serendipita indica (strain DSM 11827) TaxID=1109443 RepID=G4TUR6_SERID|nr:hypothetical protein PIIN_09044 [Serendipita indica DSM 11827]
MTSVESIIVLAYYACLLPCTLKVRDGNILDNEEWGRRHMNGYLATVNTRTSWPTRIVDNTYPDRLALYKCHQTCFCSEAHYEDVYTLACYIKLIKAAILLPQCPKCWLEPPNPTLKVRNTVAKPNGGAWQRRPSKNLVRAHISISITYSSL